MSLPHDFSRLSCSEAQTCSALLKFGPSNSFERQLGEIVCIAFDVCCDIDDQGRYSLSLIHI